MEGVGMSEKAVFFDGTDLRSAQSGTLAEITKIGGGFAIGGATDFTEIETDGTLEFNGAATVWDDVNIGGVVLGGPPATHPDIVLIQDSTGTSTGVYGLAFAIGENGSGFIEVPHAAKVGANVQVHIHWTGNAAPTGTDYVRWSLTYFFVGEGETIPAGTTIEVETAYDTQYKRVTSNFAAFAADPMDQLGFTVSRITATGDAYAGDAIALTIGVHYEIDTVGSRQITTK
jgi:hypothetical protein